MWVSGNRTLWTLHTSDPRHFGTILLGPNCPNTLTKDRLDLSAKVPDNIRPRYNKQADSIIPYLCDVGFNTTNGYQPSVEEVRNVVPPPQPTREVFL